METSIWNPVYLDKIWQIDTYSYLPVRTGTRRYKAVNDYLVWHRPVPVGISQYKISWFWNRMVQASKGFSELVQDSTRRYKPVPDFLYRYRTVQDGTSWYQIFRVGT
jgi:hypothetical protein